MRSLFITFDGINEPLGQSQILPYVKGLNEKGINFHILSFEKENQKIGQTKKELNDLGIAWNCLSWVSGSPIGVLAELTMGLLYAMYIIIFKKIDVVHARSYYPGFIAYLCKKFFGVKFIFDMRGFMVEERVDSNIISEGSIIYKLLKFSEKRELLAADVIITLTDETIEIIKKYDYMKNKSIKSISMPTCVNLNKFFLKKENKSEQPKMIKLVYAGSLGTWYKLDEMVKFYSILKFHIPNSHFLILTRSDTQEIYEAISKYELEKSEFTIKGVSSSEMPEFLNSCDIGISFIYDSYSKQASFPTKIAEYLSCGLPVVLNTQCSFLRRTIESNNVGYAIDEFNEENYEKAVAKIMNMLTDKEIHKKCRNVAEKNLGTNVCIERYIKAYNMLDSESVLKL